MSKTQNSTTIISDGQKSRNHRRPPALLVAMRVMSEGVDARPRLLPCRGAFGDIRSAI